jgi:hypothetical protein
MQQELFGLFWQEGKMLQEIRILFKSHREIVVLRWYNTLDGGWTQTEVLSRATFYH